MGHGNFVFFFFLNKKSFLTDLALMGHDNFVGFFPEQYFFLFFNFLFSIFYFIFIFVIFICFDWQRWATIHQRCSMKKGGLRSFTKVTEKHLPQSLGPATSLNKRLWHRCFTVNFAKFLRTPFLQKTSMRLLRNLSLRC